MNAKFREFVKTGRGKLTVALGCLALSWIFLLWQFSGSIGDLMPAAERIGAVEREVRELRQQNAALKARQKAAGELRTRYGKQLGSYWREERDGVVDTELRNRIQQAARDVELKLNSLGSVRTSRINTELYYAEIDLSTVGTLEAITAFLAKLREKSPLVSWRRFDLRPEPVRGQNASSAGTVVQNLNFNGAIRVIGFDGDAAENGGGGK